MPMVVRSVLYQWTQSLCWARWSLIFKPGWGQFQEHLIWNETWKSWGKFFFVLQPLSNTQKLNINYKCSINSSGILLTSSYNLTSFYSSVYCPEACGFYSYPILCIQLVLHLSDNLLTQLFFLSLVFFLSQALLPYYFLPSYYPISFLLTMRTIYTYTVQNDYSTSEEQEVHGKLLKCSTAGVLSLGAMLWQQTAVASLGHLWLVKWLCWLIFLRTRQLGVQERV